MSIMELVAALVGILAWPAAVVTVMLVLRRPSAHESCVRRIVDAGKPRRVAESLTASAENLGYDLDAFGRYVAALGEVPVDSAKVDRLRRQVVR